MNEIPFADVQDVRVLFDNVQSDRRIARTFLRRETLDLYGLVGLRSRTRLPEMTMVGAIRERLQDSVIEVPTCNCGDVSGLRWKAADDEIAVTYGLHPSLQMLPENLLPFIPEAFAFVGNLGRRLKFIAAPQGEVPKIMVMAGPYDGPGRTLGVTIYYDVGNDDLSVALPSGESPVRVVIDTAENWTVQDYFRTVLRHELIHASGVGHAPNRLDLMFASYTGVKLGPPGRWTQMEMDQRYYANLIT